MLTHGDDDNADRRNLCQHEWIVCNRVKYKAFRRVATRYDKLASSFLAFVHIASIWLLSI